MKLADAMFAYSRAECEFGDAMVDAGFGEYTHVSGDDYDNSIEFHGVANDARLSAAQQQIVFEAGFSKAYVNHKDGWETHYTWSRQAFEPIRGWRRYIEHDKEPGPSGVVGFAVMKISYWPEGWGGSMLERERETGKIVIVPDPFEPELPAKTNQ